MEVASRSTSQPAQASAEERIAQLTRTLEMTKHLAAEIREDLRKRRPLET